MFKDKSNLTIKAGRSFQYLSIVVGLLISFLAWSFVTTEKNKKIEQKSKPLLFEQNMGQYDSKIKYLSKGKGYNIALGLHPVIELFRYETTDTKQNFRLNDLDDLPRDLKIVDHSILRMHISNANSKAKVIAQDKAVTISNYLTGLKPHWKTNIPNFKSIRYEEILKNIDVVYYGNNGRFEYDFVVKPNARVADITFNFDGVKGISINKEGQLLLDLGNHKIIQKKPIAYQMDKNGEKQLVTASYHIESGKIGFNIGKYDSTKELIIDPVLEYSRYYGGSQNDTVYALDVDASDNIYMIGLTASPDLATIGAYQEGNFLIRNEDTRILDCFHCGTGETERTHIDSPVSRSIFITKFSPDGNTVIWSTYFSHQDGKPLFLSINSAAVSANGEVAFGLFAHAPAPLPLVNPTQTIPSQFENTYIAKLNEFGNDIVFSTYLNQGAWGRLIGLDVSIDGSVVASGGVDKVYSNFPEINPLPGQSCEPEEGENYDGWVIHFDSNGTATFSSCLGGAISSGLARDFLRGVTIGSNNHIYTVGYSAMTDFPVVNPIQANQSFPGNRDTTITEIDHINSEIVFSTYLGPVRNGDPIAYFKNLPIDIEVDANGNIFVIGVTSYVGWPHIKAFQPNLNTTNITSIPNYPSLFSYSHQLMNLDIYLTKINPSSADIIFSTYLGGSGGERYYPILDLDNSGNSYVFSMTDSDDYPLANPIQTSRMGKVSSAISQFSPQGALCFLAT
ncbi:MAG: SBBP repeat-containing protein [Alcanivoracaceae bacterium]|nr:SBBP repeat-containing protein [Alcanivoracaceae bacterium]